VSVETGTHWRRIEGGADEGAARSGGEWRKVRFITNLDGKNGGGEEADTDGSDDRRSASGSEYHDGQLPKRHKKN
jgi:hypothetical protein